MKYLYLIIFNIVAFFILWAFFFPKGGLLDNLEKMDQIAILEFDKAKNQVQLEEMKSRMKDLKSMQINDPQYLAYQGRKLDNTVIFRINQKDNLFELNQTFIKQREYIKFRLFFLVGMVVLLLIIGNILLIRQGEIRV